MLRAAGLSLSTLAGIISHKGAKAQRIFCAFVGLAGSFAIDDVFEDSGLERARQSQVLTFRQV